MNLTDQLAGGSEDQGGGVSLTGAIVGLNASVGWGEAGALGEGGGKDGEEEAGGFT